MLRKGITRRRVIIYWILVGLCMALIFGFSAQNSNESASLSGSITGRVLSLIPAYRNSTPDVQQQWLETAHFLIRKGAHFTIYAVLGVLCYLAMRCYVLMRPLQMAIAWGIGILYAMTDEFHQMFVPGRGPAIRDVLIDSAGALTGILLTACVMKLCKKRR